MCPVMQLFMCWTCRLELEVVVIIDASLPKLEHSLIASTNCVDSSKLQPVVQSVVEKSPVSYVSPSVSVVCCAVVCSSQQ